MRRISLSLKVPLLIVLGMLIAGSMDGWLAIAIIRDGVRTQALEANTNAAHLYANALQSYLDNARSALETTADLPEMRDFASARLIDPALHGLPPDVDRPKRDVAALVMEHSQVFEYMMLLQADGAIYFLEPYDLQVKASRDDLAFTAWYKELMRAGQTVVSDLHISTATQRPTVVIATPMLGPDGQIIGVWAGALKLEYLSQLGRGPESSTPRSYGYMTDGRGLVIAHQARVSYVEAQTDFSTLLPVRAALAGQTGADQFLDPIDRTEKLAAYAPLAWPGWAVVYETPAQVAFASINDLARAITLLAAGVSVLVALGGVVLVRQITAPLARLTAAAEAIGAGDLTRRIEVGSEDELGRLADEFNRMAGALGRRVAELSALNAMAAIVNESLDVDEILNRALDEALRQVGVEAGGIMLLDKEAGELALAAHRGHSEEFVRAASRIKLGEGLAGRAAQTGQPAVIGRLAEYPGALKAFVENERIQSGASAPLLGRTGVIGAMSLGAASPQYFDAAGLELLVALGRQIAIGVEKARLYEAAQRELAERQRAEEEIRRLNEELEQRVVERTAQLAAANQELEGEIAERKRVEEAQRRLVAILDATTDFVGSADAAGQVVYINNAGRKMVGIGADEDLSNLTILDVIAERERGFVANELIPAVVRDNVWSGETALVSREGREIPVWLVGIALKSPDGSVESLSAVSRDITERKQAEAEILRRNRELSALYTISRATAQSLDLEQTLNNAIETTLAVLESEMGGILLVEPDGQTMTLRVHRGLSDEFVRAVQRIKLGEGTAGKAAAEKKPIVLDISAYPTQRLAPFFVREGIQTTASTPLLSGGEVVGTLSLAARRARAFPPEEPELLAAIGQQLGSAVRNAQLYEAVQRELAERKRAEAAVQKLNTDLERRAADLEAANKELEAFSYTVSHDLRAPLRAIDGFSRILLEDYAAQLVPEAQRTLRVVRDNSRQMGRLVDDLLTFSRLGRQPVQAQTVAITPLVRQALDELHAEQEGRQVEIVVGDLPPSRADPALLKQVWINLLSNALKFTRKREAARVEIGCQRTDGEDVYFVKDNGVGFNMRYRDKLFGVFQRLHRAEEYEGTGVGLAIVQRIVHRHGGQVSAEAEVDKGATFYFTLGGGTND